ncbi:unnamed protein product [Bathycoccus prasinos]
MAAPKFGKVAVHNFPLSYYYKVATASFVCGAAVEAFMIHTGFYEKVTQIEANRRADFSTEVSSGKR